MNPENKKFEICSRAIILRQDKILICKPKNEPWYFFPGGHVDFGEKAAGALKRELKEELSVLVDKFNFIGAVENYFEEKRITHHELNMVFIVDLAEKEIKNIEGHIEFEWASLNDFENKDVFPTELKKAVLEWIKNKKCFWRSNF